MDDKLLGMPQYSFVEVGGPLRSGFLFMLQLAWESRFRLPVLLIVGLMVLDVRMQLEIDFDAELVQERRQQHNGNVADEGDNDDGGEDDDSDEDEFEIDDENDIDDDDLETIEDEDLSSMSDSYEVFEWDSTRNGPDGVSHDQCITKEPGSAAVSINHQCSHNSCGPNFVIYEAHDGNHDIFEGYSITYLCQIQENEITLLMIGSQVRTTCIRNTMRSPLPLSLRAPNLWVGIVFLAVVTGALIPEGMLLEDPIVESPPETPRQLQASSSNRHETHLINSMEVDEEDESIGGEEEPTCYMEIQVTRRIPGRCVSLGRSRVCVAGAYLHPFHHDCV